MEKVYQANKDRGLVLLAVNIMEAKNVVEDRVEIEGFTFLPLRRPASSRERSRTPVFLRFLQTATGTSRRPF